MPDAGSPALAACNYAATLTDLPLSLQRFEEAKLVLRKTIPVARRVLGREHRLTFKMRWNYARALYDDDGATLDDLREASNTLEDVEPVARRVLGGSHPDVAEMKKDLQLAQAALRARETPSPRSA